MRTKQQPSSRAAEQPSSRAAEQLADVPRRPSPPAPGHWKVMQTMAGKVRQFAVTCSRCMVTTYIACNKEMDPAAEVIEHCSCLGARERPIPGSVLFKVIPNKTRFKPSV